MLRSIKIQVYTHTVSQINVNGIISFGSSFESDTPHSLPLTGSDRIIAPYWSSVDIRETGTIYYRQTTDPSLLTRATSEIKTVVSNVVITHLLIVTWDSVGYYNQKTDKVYALDVLLSRIVYFIDCSTLVLHRTNLTMFSYFLD